MRTRVFFLSIENWATTKIMAAAKGRAYNIRVHYGYIKILQRRIFYRNDKEKNERKKEGKKE